MLRSLNFLASEKCMKYFSGIDYQRQLIIASLDDFSPNAALPNFRGEGTDETEVWRQAVIEFLCINVKHGFIEATHYPEIRVGYDINKLEDILINGDKKNHIDPVIVWNTLYFNGTSDLINIVEKFNLREWRCANFSKECDGFISFLRETYEI